MESDVEVTVGCGCVCHFCADPDFACTADTCPCPFEVPAPLGPEQPPCPTCACGSCDGFKDAMTSVMVALSTQLEINNTHLDVLARACQALVPALDAIDKSLSGLHKREGVEWDAMCDRVNKNTQTVAAMASTLAAFSRTLDDMVLVATPGKTHKKGN